MTKIRRNHAIHGASGKFGTLVYKQRNGETIVAQAPLPSTVPLSNAQETVIATFKNATTYGKAACSDPARKAFYESKAKPGQTAYNMAVADFCKAPLIGDINSDGYSGAIGESIRVKVTDNIEVTGVKVKIEKVGGALVELGDATISSDGLHWEYITAKSSSNISGFVITISAADLPGNVSVKQKTL